MTFLSRFVPVLTLCLLALPGCGGGGAVGDACDAPGDSTDACDGGICGDNGAGELECLVICDEHEDCADGESCNGVEGSNMKGCRTDQ